MDTYYWNCRIVTNVTLNETFVRNSFDYEEILYDYISPVVFPIGVLLSLVNVFIFSRKQHFQHEIYRYLFVHSVAVSIQLTLAFIHYFKKSAYFNQRLYEHFALILFDYASDLAVMRCVVNLMVFIEFIISIKRLLLIFNLNLTISISLTKTLLIYSLISVLMCLPFLLKFKIVKLESAAINCRFSASMIIATNQTPIYDLVQNPLEISALLHHASKIPNIFSGIILPIVLSITNTVIFIDFRKSSKKFVYSKSSKPKSKSSQRLMPKQQQQQQAAKNSNSHRNPNKIIYDSKKNLTRLVISINCLFIISNISISILLTLIMIKGFKPSQTHSIISYSALAFNLTHCIEFPFYLYFDKCFNQAFRFYLRKFLGRTSTESDPVVKSDEDF